MNYRVLLVFILILAGCAANHQKVSMLDGTTLSGAPVCLDNRDNIPAIVKKFFNTRDLTTEEGKIDYLIERVRDSKLIFIRNRVEYDSPSAASFLRWKYNRWRKAHGVVIDTAQDFIDRVASGSKMSGQAYAVVLKDGSRHNLQAVLQNELETLEYCLQREAEAENQAVTAAAALAKPPLQTEPVPPQSSTQETTGSNEVPPVQTAEMVEQPLQTDESPQP